MSGKFSLENSRENLKKYKMIKSLLVLDRCHNLEPEISIMIPTYKRPHLIKDAIDSAVRQKSDVTFEVVIVDNDGDGEFGEELINVIGSFPNANIRYFRNTENIGMFGNWNRCIELARGKYLTILNDDDMLSPLWMDYVVKYRDCSLVKVGYDRFNSDMMPEFGVAEQYKASKIDIKSCLYGNINPGSLGLLLNKDSCIDIDGFNENFFPSSDYEFIVRYISNFGGYNIDRNLSYYRWEENESMKDSVRLEFVIQDYHLRREYFNDNLLFDSFNKIIAIKYYYTLFGKREFRYKSEIMERLSISKCSWNLYKIMSDGFIWKVFHRLSKLTSTVR